MLCRACNNEKTTGDFYPGVASRCKECHKAAMKFRRLTNPAVQKYDRERAKTPKRRANSRRISIAWRQEHPDAYKAQTAVNNALRDGRLTKQPCAICGTEKHVHGHHSDYSKPLAVKWLCAKCHHRIHATFPEFGGHREAAE
jgi:hypothetical protein